MCQAIVIVVIPQGWPDSLHRQYSMEGHQLTLLSVLG